MLTIRLQRTGSKNKPAFRIVLAQAHKAASKKFLEVLGHYNPVTKQFLVKNEERLKYWLSQHVKLSPTIHNLLVEKKLLDEKKVKAWNPKKKPQAEAQPAAQAPAASPQEALPVSVEIEGPAQAAKQEEKTKASAGQPQ